jgi:Protein of unknown function (DUF664)
MTTVQTVQTLESPVSAGPPQPRLLVDLIQEYARHPGHPDLIRESVDLLVGEGANAGS